jgi:carbon-monoxide dehydrogenase medium subunit
MAIGVCKEGRLTLVDATTMKPPPFRYHDPRTVGEAVGLLGSLENAKLLAGGQSLMPMLNMRFVLPDHIIDLNRVEGLSYIRESDGAMEIGAMTRQRDLEFSDVVRKRFPIMHEALLQVGHRQTRNRGTIGGSLCHLDPAAELVSLALGHDATVTIAGPNGQRELAFAEFPAAYMAPAIEPNELVVAVGFPRWSPNHSYAFIEFSRRHGDFAITSAAVLLETGAAGKITRASVTLGGVGTAPSRAREVEQAIIGQVPTGELFRDACESCRKLEALDDVHAPASYRQHLAAVLSRRALEKAHARLLEREGTRVN